MSSVTFDINLSRSRKVLTLRAAQHKLTEPTVGNPMRLPQKFVERSKGPVPLRNGGTRAHATWGRGGRAPYPRQHGFAPPACVTAAAASPVQPLIACSYISASLRASIAASARATAWSKRRLGL